MSDINGAADYKKTFKYRASLWAVIILSTLIVLALVAMVAAMVVLSPDMAVETTTTITNIIWVALAIAPFAFISVPKTNGSALAMETLKPTPTIRAIMLANIIALTSSARRRL